MEGISDPFSLLQAIKDNTLELDTADMEEVQKELCKESIELNGTKFGFKKLPGKEAFTIAELVRKELGFTLLGDANISSFLHFGALLFLGASEEFMIELKDKLFQHIMFANSNTATTAGDTYKPIGNMENQAITEALDTYELIFRGLAVNFLPSALEKGSSLIQMLQSFQVKQVTRE